MDSRISHSFPRKKPCLPVFKLVHSCSVFVSSPDSFRRLSLSQLLTFVYTTQMLSLRSILVVAAAFVSLASAVPVASHSEELVARQFFPVHDSSTPEVLDSDIVTVEKRDDTSLSLGDHITATYDQIRPLVAEIKVIVAVAGFDSNKVGDLIDEIVGLLNGLIADIKYIVGLGLGVTDLLLIGGVPCSIGDLAAVVYSLLALVAQVLVLVLDLVSSLPDPSLVALIYSVATLLVQIVAAVVVVPGLDDALAVLLGNLEGSLELLHAGQILVLVGL